VSIWPCDSDLLPVLGTTWNRRSERKIQERAVKTRTLRTAKGSGTGHLSEQRNQMQSRDRILLDLGAVPTFKLHL